MRSACSITIRLALGTSTPTSITVVATSTFRLPATNCAMISAFSAGFMRPCTKPMASWGSAACSSASVSVAAFSCRLSLSSISGHTQYACCPFWQVLSTKPSTSARRTLFTNLVLMGVRLGGNSSMVETSKSAKNVIASVRGMGVADIIS